MPGPDKAAYRAHEARLQGVAGRNPRREGDNQRVRECGLRWTPGLIVRPWMGCSVPKLEQQQVDAAYRMFHGEGKDLGHIARELGCEAGDLNPWLTASSANVAKDVKEDAARFQALMRCGRIKPQGSAGVDPKTGERTYPSEPGSVHFGAEFWVQPEEITSRMTIWGRHCLRALADDILAFEAAAKGPLG